MTELSQKDIRTINENIRNILEERELAPESVIRKFRIAAADDKAYKTVHYSLDVVISVEYRIKYLRGTQLREIEHSTQPHKVKQFTHRLYKIVGGWF